MHDVYDDGDEVYVHIYITSDSVRVGEGCMPITGDTLSGVCIILSS